LAKEGSLELKGAVSIVKNAAGEVKVEEVGDVDAKHGAVFGAITGGLVGLIGGPIGAIAGAVAGAATGGVTAKFADFGISNDTIKNIEKALTPGSSAALVYTDLKWGDKAAAQLERSGAEVVRLPLDEGSLRAFGQNMVQ
jgi:uncharacterized membrane protein